MKSFLSFVFLAGVVVGGSIVACAQSDSGPMLDPAPTAKHTKKRVLTPDPGPQPSTPQTESSDRRPVRPADSSEESSSRDTLIDLRPPNNDAKDHPGAEPDNTGVTEFHPWDPHKAMKNVEVGDYYAKRKNFPAAISRYREALEYKPKDAEATFKLAEALEHAGQQEEAAETYAAYLKITPHGDFAEQANKALQRLNEKSGNNAAATSAPKPKS